MRIFIGLIVQILAIIFIGSSYLIERDVGGNFGIITLSIGIVLWTFAYWVLHDYKTDRKKEKYNEK